jgi:hypothetical protein
MGVQRYAKQRLIKMTTYVLKKYLDDALTIS